MFQGPVECEVYKLVCRRQNPQCTRFYSGSRDGIFFWSKKTAIMEELGWDFIHQIELSTLSFSAFCKIQTMMYHSHYRDSAPFVSCSTFVRWWFAFAAAMKIDFRLEVDPYCKHSPKFLACDGTHVGVSKKHEDTSKNHLIDADLPINVDPKHLRFSRVFMPYQNGIGKPDSKTKLLRSHLVYLCNKAIGFDQDREPFISDADERGWNADILSRFDRPGTRNICVMIEMVIDISSNSCSSELISAIAKMLKGFICDASFITFFPLRDLIKYKEIVSLIASGRATTRDFNALDLINPEACKVIREAVLCGNSEVTKTVRLALCEFAFLVEEMHRNDGEPQAECPIEDSYNPESGIALAFTPHGNQLRETRRYNASNSKSSETYDEPPEKEENKCNKAFPSVGMGGYAFMFLWFCAIHGHSYGFHLIKGAEGRRDPFNALFKYFFSFPWFLFYDFGCGLSEYALNREPAYWARIRIFQDIFHNFGHNCGFSYDFARLKGLRNINSEICEQFNSFIQCIKYTGTHLSQSHFIFLMQFFIMRWNHKKTQTRTNKLKYAYLSCK